MNKFLIVGLGNIGSEYENTRHNIGFKVLDFLAQKQGVTFSSDKLGSRAEFKIKGRALILIKPSTYMNLSGKSVRYHLEKEKIPLENLLVVCDDLALPFGSIRVKAKGSDGGHNGLKNINEILCSQAYARFRFGIGDEFAKGRQVDYVLGEWNTEECSKMNERLEKSAELVLNFALAGLSDTMNKFNGK